MRMAVAIAIKLDSAGTVFFGHEREGRLGKVFRCLKFRTMCVDAHLEQLGEFNENTVVHIHKEEKVLFPGALEAQAALNGS